MGLDITFVFSEGEPAYSHMRYGSFSQYFAPYLSLREYQACFQRDGYGKCEDKNICLKVYSMVLARGYVQDNERLDDYPICMYFE